MASIYTSTVSGRGGTANSVDISITGNAELQRKLAQISRAMQEEIVANALMLAAQPILAETKKLCPVETGALRDGIRATLERRKAFPSVQISTPTRAQLKIPGDAKYYYPAVLEYGAWIRNQRQISSYRDYKGRLRKMTRKVAVRIKAYRYMRDGLNNRAAEAIGIIAQQIRAGLARAGVK